MLTEFFPQGTPVQSQQGCGMTLIVLGVVQHGFEKRFFYLMQHHVIKLTAGLSVEGLKEMANRFPRAVSQRWRACRGFLATLGGSAV
jgi:hypothetical protein